MKKIQLLVLVLVLVAFGSCKKENPNQNTTAPKYVKAIAGSYFAKDGGISFKSQPDLPTSAKRVWTMYARNSIFYANANFGLVKGKEFITGSSEQVWWATEGNNPASFTPADQGVYSNITPAEPLRLITEGFNAANELAYLGMLDFNPTYANFPLTVNCYRLGDILKIKTSGLTSLPGGSNLTITATFKVAPIDINATEFNTSQLSVASSTPNGYEFKWADIKYGTPVERTVTASGSLDANGFITLYGELDGKVVGNVVITINEPAHSAAPARTITLDGVPAKGPGLGMSLELKTTKVGWYDSQTVNFGDTNITVEPVVIEIN